jgi:hypothetical protein
MNVLITNGINMLHQIYRDILDEKCHFWIENRPNIDEEIHQYFVFEERLRTTNYVEGWH